MLSVVISYLRVCLKGRGPGPVRPPEPDLGLSRWRLNGLNLATVKVKCLDSQGPASGAAASCPVPPMAGQASPHLRGSKDMAHKVRFFPGQATAPTSPDLAQRWAMRKLMQIEVGLPIQLGPGSLGSALLPGPSQEWCGPQWCVWVPAKSMFGVWASRAAVSILALVVWGGLLRFGLLRFFHRQVRISWWVLRLMVSR